MRKVDSQLSRRPENDWRSTVCSSILSHLAARSRKALEHNRARIEFHPQSSNPLAEFSPEIATENPQTENHARIECAVRHTMDTVFLTPEQLAGFVGDAKSGSFSDLMSSATKPITRSLLQTPSAANADDLGDTTVIETKSMESTGAWDSYDVWRRFIKEARDRRKNSEPN
jgi:hypothetical protein